MFKTAKRQIGIWNILNSPQCGNFIFFYHSDFTWNQFSGFRLAKSVFLFQEFLHFWKKKSKFRLSKFAKMAVLELVNSPNLISRKIWVTKNSWNFHIAIVELISRKIWMSKNWNCFPFQKIYVKSFLDNLSSRNTHF